MLSLKQFRKIGLIVIALLLIGSGLWQMEQPRQLVWGEYFQPHADNRVLTLTASRSFQQSFKLGLHTVAGLLLELKEKDYSNYSGSIRVTVSQEEKQTTSITPLSQTTPTGHLLVSFPAIKTNSTKPVSFVVTLVESEQSVGLKFQPDSKKFTDGELLIIEGAVTKKRSGHIAFSPQYLASARELTNLALLPWLALLGMIVIAIASYKYLQKKIHTKKKIFHLSRRDVVLALVIATVAGAFVWLHLLPANSLPTNGDMTKDMLYLQTISQTVINGDVPFWHHATCGGQPLFGNPETSVLSAGTPLALLFGPVIGLKLLLSFEVAAAALGIFFLARFLGLRPLGATFSALLLPLSGFVINRIFLGHTMFVGGVAFMPWVLLTGYLGFKKPRFLIVSAILITLSFFRGDIRIGFYTLMSFGIICLITSLREKRWQPIVACFTIIALAAGFSLVKALPVLESAEHFHTENLPELVVPLWQQEELFNVFLDKSPTRGSIDVLNGENEGWENIGLYIGPLPILLALFGLLFAPNRVRLPFGSLLLVTVLIGEGTFYQEIMRQLPALGQLFRLPSRILVITVFAILILGGFALDKIKKVAPHPIGSILVIIIIIGATADVMLYADQTLNRATYIPPPDLQVAANQTTARASIFNTEDSVIHPITINKEGSTTPYSCQDFNEQPPFELPETKPLAMDQSDTPLNAFISNNSIVIAPSQDTTIVQVHTYGSSLLSVQNGFTLPTNEQLGPLSIAPQGSPVILDYRSTAALPGFLLSMGFFLLALSTIQIKKSKD
jgi:hypothetical protein